MVAALRAAALVTSTLVASSGPLAINVNGTYSATVLLGERSVKLAVDMRRFGVWMSCRLFEDNKCDVGVSGYPRLESIEYSIRSFPEVTIAGQVFKNLDVYVAYDPLNLVDASMQGYLGLAGQETPDTPAFGEGSNATTIALQLGTTAADSKLTINSIDSALLREKQQTTKTRVDARISCVRLPLSSSNLTVDGCAFAPQSNYLANYQASFDATVPILKFEHSLLETLEARFLGTCSKVQTRNSLTDEWVGYLCNANTKLPVITIQMGGWEFYLDPVDYTAPVNASATGITPQVNVLIGGSRTRLSWVLGTPFLRKFPIVLNTTQRSSSRYYNLYCVENTTCRAVPERVINPLFSGGGGDGRGGRGQDDGGGGGGDVGLKVEISRKRKLHLSIGLSIGGVILLACCGCLFKCCREVSKGEDDIEKDGEIVIDDASLELTIALNEGEVESPEQEAERKDKAATIVPKRRSVQDDDSDGDSSSSDDTESSKENRQDRCRRRERKEMNAVSGSEASTAQNGSEAGTHYTAVKSP